MTSIGLGLAMEALAEIRENLRAIRKSLEQLVELERARDKAAFLED